MGEELEVIPEHTAEAADRVNNLVDETKEQIQEIEDLKPMVDGQYSINDMPNTEDFVEAWRDVSKPSEEYDFYRDRLHQIMDEQNFTDIVYADIYDEFTLFPQYQDLADTVVSSLKQNDVIVPPLAAQINNFMKGSQNARIYQLNDFEKERQQLRSYEEELGEITDRFQEMNQHRMPLDVDRANSFWRQLESFDERVESMRESREADYDGDYNTADLYAFLGDTYEADLGVRQPVMADLDAVESRTEEARDNIVI